MNKRIGFTLIEVLLVAAIIGILVAVLVPSLVSARSRGYQVAIDSCGKAIIFAQQIYELDNKVYAVDYSSLDSKAVRPCISTGTLIIVDGPYSKTEHWLISSNVGGKPRQVDAEGIRYN